MERKVSQKAQKMANAYVSKFEQDTINEGQEFDIYANARFYTFSFKNNRGYWTARFEHYGRRS